MHTGNEKTRIRTNPLDRVRTTVDREKCQSAADRKVRGRRGRGSGLDVGSQTRYYVNSEISEQASGSTMGYEDEVGSLESG